MNLTKLKIITPNGLFFDGIVEIVTMKTFEGFIGIQHGKSPFMAQLDIAELKIGRDSDSKQKIAAISGGLVYATPKSVEIITDAIEFIENIDKARAKKAKDKAEIIINNSKIKSELYLAELALKRALNRLHKKS
ncbi:MAG: ATP synthase F1 subunit epsilon [Mollicutes bacterium PWAP]|nr:ATP synthase F1 subunit epsilon [Mollicutes bacterium PWAP]